MANPDEVGFENTHENDGCDEDGNWCVCERDSDRLTSWIVDTINDLKKLPTMTIYEIAHQELEHSGPIEECEHDDCVVPF